LRHDLLASVEGAIEIELLGFCSWSRRDRCDASMSRRRRPSRLVRVVRLRILSWS